VYVQTTTALAVYVQAAAVASLQAVVQCYVSTHDYYQQALQLTASYDQ